MTLRSTDVEYLLRDEDVIYGHGPTPRNIGNFFRNLRLAWRVLREQDPSVIVSTGAGLALPFFLLGRLQRRRLVYVESITRVEKLALTGRLVYPLADCLLRPVGSLARAAPRPLPRERRVIFATVGSTQIPSSGFVGRSRRCPAAALWSSTARCGRPSAAARAIAYMQFPQVIESMEAADVVVCHAGAGSILCALRAGHTPSSCRA